jgi:hypothetical protein
MPHSPYFGPGFYASLHLAAARPSIQALEYNFVQPDAWLSDVPALPRGPELAIPGGPGDPVVKREGSEPTEDEKKSSGYALRIQNGLNILKALTSSDPGVAKPELLPQALSRIPFVGEQVANAATSSKRQQVEAAQLDMLDAALTLNTGAAYTKEQLQGLSKSYFPATGDSAETIKAKQERLDGLIATARMRAGRMDERSQSLVVNPQIGQPQTIAPEERISIGGKNYIRRGGQWYQE